MNTSLAENEYRYGTTGEFCVRLILAPDVELRLFLDGSSLFETTRNLIVTESCWVDDEVREPSFIDLVEG